jgi:type I restriction enzyme, S subunit
MNSNQMRRNTEAVQLPKSWQYLPLCKVVDSSRPISYGIVQTGPNIENGVLCIRVVDLTKPTLDKRFMIRTTPAISNSYKRTILQENDVIIALRGEIGLSKRIDGQLSNANLTRGVALISKSVKMDARFVVNVLQSVPVKRRMLNSTNGSALQEIPIGSLRKILIPVPPLPEQKKIAEILSTWDTAIEQVRKLIEAKKQFKNGFIQKLLSGRLRLPEFGKAIKKANGIPLGWKKARLGELFIERDETNPNLPLLSITGDRGIVSRHDVDRKDTSNPDKSKYKRVVKGDIGYNTMRMWQGVSAVSDREGIISPAYTVCIPQKGIDPSYFGFLFKSPLMIHTFHRYSQGLVDDTLNLKFPIFAQIGIVFPSLDEQKKIAALLTIIDREITLIAKKGAAIKRQKNHLIQNLLTGQIRVKTDN